MSRRSPKVKAMRDGSGDSTDDACANCGDPVDVTEWHPLDAVVDESGSTTLYVFCSLDCRREWRDGETGP